MTSKSPVRTCEDLDEQALSYAEIKALCAGNPLIAEKMGLDIEVAKLKMLKANHQSEVYRMEDNLRLHFPEQIEKHKTYIKDCKADKLSMRTEIDEAVVSGSAALKDWMLETEKDLLACTRAKKMTLELN